VVLAEDIDTSILTRGSAASSPSFATTYASWSATAPCSACGSGGDSMIDAAICDRDIVVVRQQPDAFGGDIVAAMIDGEATVGLPAPPRPRDPGAAKHRVPGHRR
jgi:repressor LexA